MVHSLLFQPKTRLWNTRSLLRIGFVACSLILSESLATFETGLDHRLPTETAHPLSLVCPTLRQRCERMSHTKFPSLVFFGQRRANKIPSQLCLGPVETKTMHSIIFGQWPGLYGRFGQWNQKFPLGFVLASGPKTSPVSIFGPVDKKRHSWQFLWPVAHRVP